MKVRRLNRPVAIAFWAALGSSFFALCSYAQTNVKVENGGKVSVGGTSTTTMKFEAGGTLTVSGTSTFALSATSTTTPAGVSRLGSSGTYTVIFNSSATLDANNFKFDYINIDGIQVKNGAKLTKFRNGTFSNPPNSGVYLNLNQLISSTTFSDNFESYSLGGDPTPTWTVKETIDSDNPGVEDAVVTVMNSIPGNSTQVVEILAPANSTPDGADPYSSNVYIRKTWSAVTSGYVTFLARRPATNNRSRITLSDGTNNFDVTFASDGNLKTEAAGSGQTYQAYSANTWYTIKIEWTIVPGSGDTWTVSVDGTPKGTANWNNGVNYGGITSILFHQLNADAVTGGTIYIDDVSVMSLTTGFVLDGTDRSNTCYSANNITFNSSGAADINNVRAGPKTPVIYFLGRSNTDADANNPGNGDRWGESYDDDPYDRIRWISRAVKRSDGIYFDTFERALASSGTTTHTLTAVKNIPFDENLDLAGKNVIIENAVFAPGSGTAVINATGPATGTLRNSVIAAGGVSTVNAVQNCTIYRVDSNDPVIVVTNSTLTNCLIENGATLTGTTTTTSLLVTSSGFFVDRTNMDFHLIAPGGSPDTSTAIDKGTNLSGSFTTDLEGKTRPYDHPTVANGTSTFDMGAYEHRGINPVVPTVALDLGNTTRIMAGGNRPNAANSAMEGVFYAITAGGSSSTGNDYKLIVLGSTTFNVISTYTVNKPITYITFYTVSTTLASFERRIFLVIDYDENGEGDRILPLIDRGADEAITADTAFDGAGDPEGDGDGTKPFGLGPLKWLTLIRLSGEAAADEEPTANSTQGMRLFCVSGNVLYKINAAPQDTTDDGSPDNKKYGDIIWSNSQRTWEYRAVLNYVSAIGDLFVSSSDHSSGGSDNRTIVAQLKAGGHANDPAVVKRYWVTNDTDDGTGAPSDNIVDENANGQIIYSNSNNTVIYIAPTDGKKLISVVGSSTTAADEIGTRRYPNPSVSSDAATDWLDALAFRFFGDNYIVFGAGENVYKMYDDGSIPADNGTDGKLVAALGDTEWPKAIKGSVTSRITKWYNTIYWGTKEGYAYAKGYVNSHASSSDESDVNGYPYLIAPGQRVTEIWATGEGIYFVTDQGRIVRFALQ